MLCKSYDIIIISNNYDVPSYIFSRKLQQVQSGPTKHRKELQGTENSAKNYKVLQGTTRYFQTKHKVAENTTRNYKVLENTTRN